MADDLDAFLQRAAQKRKKKRPEIVVLEPGQSPPSSPSRPLQSRPPLPQRAPLVVPEVVDTPVVLPDEDVGEHVTRHIDTRPFTQRASHLGEEVGLADDKMDAHLQEVFEHRVGRLGESDLAPAPERASSESPLAADLLKMLSTPENLRQAILLQEILTPPEHRWR